ncbi:hypothetical protein K437DRAFT_54262 [Tilletiaria anomala UBC 951]|uniref:BZIP domain-containing protein n=1 Tax=Tilletiaria anomala (strain ATCC 24038 / CBS 436.72 / UBC 951) TaxID=1037660 RepID=A0A066V448_TILAU|nr:uncharacterized protein K437DRAFT_54262 [Tilletiaria anomala UBC 951]KDN36487.1 hypothetical protein K437DRAFT_54262 [Tilletiaria anomala UBC 951]
MDGEEDEEEWTPSPPKPRTGKVRVFKRMVQNRKAQREFHKWRETRTRDLEARCRRFNQMGLEANVELQRVAWRPKEDNDVVFDLLVRLCFGNMVSNVPEGPGSPGGYTMAGVDPNVRNKPADRLAIRARRREADGR